MITCYSPTDSRREPGTMSRRKQSNPKPLKPGEDSEWTTIEEGVGPNAGDAKDQTRGVADKQQQQQQLQQQQQQQRIKAEYQSTSSPPLQQQPTASEPDQKPPSAAAAADPPRGLRLNPNLATDPACRRMPSADEPLPPPLQASHQPLQQLQQQQQPTSSSSSSSASSTSSSASSLTPAVPELAGPNVITLNTARTGQIFVCTPCGIRFSSLSTLDAHQTYYCSRRQLKDASLDDPQLPIMVIESDEIGLCNDSDSRPSSVEPSAKSARTGKQYKCPHCSYSADKKVSLNRHMRMHSTSPVSVQSPPCMQQMQPSDGGDPMMQSAAVDRYCQNCDIRFSNQRTYLAHKTHYCNTRHVVKPTPSGSPMSNNVAIVNHHHNNNNNNNIVNHNNNDPSPTNVPPTHLALPTNPVIVVPYALVQNASVISAVTADGGLSSPPADAACVVLPDGTLQPIAQARIPVGFSVIAVNNGGGGGNAPSDRRDSSQSPPEKPYSPPKNRTDARAANRGETKRPVARPSSPLDLRLKRVAGARSRGDERCAADGEDEKENRRSDGNVTDAEDIVCAPSIPCMIMSPSSSPPSAAGHKTPQPQPRGPTAAALQNGVVVLKSPTRAAVEAAQLQQQQQQRMNAEKNGNFSVSSLLKLSGKLQQQQQQQQQQHENSVKQEFPAGGGNDQALQLQQLMQQPPTVIAGRPLPQHRSNATSVVVANSAALQPPYFSAEMTLRPQENALVAGLPLQHHHQLFLKQGPSKCENCNIVFCKYQNFLAHKKHYCASRPPPPAPAPPPQPQQQQQLQDDADKTSPEGSPAGKAMTVGSPRSSKDSVSPTPAAPPPKHPIAVGQFACSCTCGINFVSYENLATHQAFYCQNRLSGAQVDPAAVQADRPLGKYCSKCKTIVDGNHQNHQCPAVANFWKCPACAVVFPSASAAQKHLDTHNGIKAFVCLICHYKGNTLRGLRTHVRMHFDKRMIPDLMEEDYVKCVIDENCDSAPSAKSPPTAAAAAISTATRGDDESQQQQQQQQPPPEERLLQVRVKQEPQNGAIASGASSDDGENSERPTSTGRRDGTEAAYNDEDVDDDDDKDADDQQPHPPPPPPPRGNGSGGCSNTAKYCKACDISFKYLATFDAHKKYYCRNSAEYNKTREAENANATTVTS